MSKRIATFLLLLLGCCEAGLALEPAEILVIANTDYPASTRLARYYCEKRGVPSGNVVPVSLGPQLRDSISRADYDKRLAGPIRVLLTTRKDLEQVKCLVTTYGVPYSVGRCEPATGMDSRLKQLRQWLQQEKDAIAPLEARKATKSLEYQQHQARMAQIQADIDHITGGQTEAAVDSELSLVLCPLYDLYRWQPNRLRSPEPQLFKTMMVCRLDGPNYGIAQGLIDKAIAAEQAGLAGTAYIDSRGLFGRDIYSHYDQSLRDLAILTRLRTLLAMREERTQALFQPGSCPQTALYCGWYSVKKYVDAFQFVDGAVGFHIASFEATGLHDPNSTAWCPALLMHGVAATLGPVSEPYLNAFPEPKAFFSELFDGRCLVEAYYRTNPFNSWQMLLLGDPLYRPFKGGSQGVEPQTTKVTPPDSGQ
ncbi:MAG: TIGR03790 family protein [Sedimentisphaerales bacterium]|nr:TIGR03790 family protein [Sedimentisphaerales bacterium]